MVAWLIERQGPASPIRAFNPGRHLSQLADLVEIAFASELNATGSQIAAEMRQMALWGPALRLAQPLLPLLAGFVWIEGGELVGNASLSRDSQQGTWLLSNVAVLPEYHGRGIAGQLVDAALDAIRSRGGRRVLLQVRTGNVSAERLYSRRGFVKYDTLYELEVTYRRWTPPLQPVEALVRAVRPSDSSRLYDIAVASTPRATLLRRPVSRRGLDRGMWWQIRHRALLGLGGTGLTELVAERRGQPVALARLSFRLLRRPHELELFVLPDERGAWESAFLYHLLQPLPASLAGNIRAYVSDSHREAVQALLELGFRTIRVLDQMALDLR